jgi:hypothetical protein
VIIDLSVGTKQRLALMFRIIAIVVRTLASSLRSRSELVLENMVLRQQLAAFKARGKTPRIGPADRAFWVLLRRLWARWAHTLVIVKPDTVVRWHRAGFRLYWRWISRRRGRAGRRPVSTEIRELIRRMASENSWGAPRIHGELLMFGLDVSERTVSRYLQRLGRRPEARQSWLTFLHNHREAIAAMALFVVFTVKFRLLYVLFVICHGRRQIVHFQELLDHVVVLNEAHLRRLLREYVAYHHDDRTHCGTRKQTPTPRRIQWRASAGARLTALPRVGGLHHRYQWRDAA